MPLRKVVGDRNDDQPLSKRRFLFQHETLSGNVSILKYSRPLIFQMKTFSAYLARELPKDMH